MLSIHPYFGRRPWLGAFDKDCAFGGTGFHSASCGCFLQSFVELLEFFFVTCQSKKIDIISESQVAKRSSFDMDVSMSSALSFPGIYEKVLETMDILVILLLSFENIGSYVNPAKIVNC